MSQTPQLMACFLLPFPLPDLGCPLPMDDSGIQHSSSPQTQAPQTMYTSDPKHKLLCIASTHRIEVFIISTRIFFDLDGLQERRQFRGYAGGLRMLVSSGTQVHPQFMLAVLELCRPFPIHEPNLTRRRLALHVMDFSPLAVVNRRG
ncbi:hypothetical protein EDD22DRAFT_898898 [Suillus occidentalis]|nr:hypothetical protein EDD22DRAFT_898898 [Suillus occidentalis]